MWLLFQVMTWNTVDTRKRAHSPTPYTQAVIFSQPLSDSRCSSATPTKAGAMRNYKHGGRPLEQGVTLFFTVGHISIVAALLKGRKHFINSSNISILLQNAGSLSVLQAGNVHEGQRQPGQTEERPPRTPVNAG
ncbi:hypothetical protein EYF80_059531 [Liparis tanakae]|uniref:Uncharacterized protein n=1 Tax=Liparis tanakae TaxID=230148 RepID=A0A4Z2ENG3_9TELE|nr:hypothetical protein EYF80_059531 [Liparis tanakae]